MIDGESIQPIIKHDQYDKLVDDLYILGRNVVLRFNVILNKYDDKYGKVSYHKEFEYYNHKANSSTVTLRRTLEYYLTLENITVTDDNPIKQYFMITLSDIMGFRLFVKDIVKWFDDPKFDGLYVYKDNNLIMTKMPESVSIVLPPSRQYLCAEPIVHQNSFNEQSPGVRLYMGSETNYVEISLNRFRGFYYLIDTIDMYTDASLLVNYLQRPDYGTNLTSYSSSRNYDPERSVPKQQSGRKIQSKAKLDDL